MRRSSADPDEPSPLGQSPEADALPGRTAQPPITRRQPACRLVQGRSPPGDPKAPWLRPTRRTVLHRAIRRPPGRIRFAEPSSTRRPEGRLASCGPVESFLAQRSENRPTRSDSWSHPAPGHPKITWSRATPSTHRTRSSTGMSTTGASLALVHREPEGLRRIPAWESEPRRPEGQPVHPTPSPAPNTARKPRFPGPRGSSGCPSELVFRAAMDDFYCPREPRTRAYGEEVQDLSGRPQAGVGYPQEGLRRPPVHPQVDHQPVDDATAACPSGQTSREATRGPSRARSRPDRPKPTPPIRQTPRHSSPPTLALDRRTDHCRGKVGW